MLQAVKRRKTGIVKGLGVVGVAYALRRYVLDRLEEVKTALDERHISQDNLRRRYRQNQEDVSYTVLALLPTLADQILLQMDVDSLTAELRSLAHPRSSPSQSQSLPNNHDVDNPSDNGSIAPSFVSATDSSANNDMDVSTSGLQSWVHTSTLPGSSVVSQQNRDPSSSALSEDILPSESSRTSSSEPSMSDSKSWEIPSNTSSTTSRTKAELWREIKSLTLTRTLTTIYSTTLFTLLTTLQLTLLARHKYVSSVLRVEREERLRQRLESQLSMSNLLFAGANGLDDLLSGRDNSMEDEGTKNNDLDDDVEKKFLTLSWWILHVGWKDMAERVRRGVDEVFDSVSLKSRLAAMDLHRLISDVRRRIEYEITFEGTQRRIDFVSTLLPPTPETTQLTLSQGGYVSVNADDFSSLDESSASLLSASSPLTLAPTSGDPVFEALLDETRELMRSSNFSLVLESCLDRITNIFFADLRDRVFPSEENSSTGDDVRTRLAEILPRLTQWSEQALRSLPNELVNNVLDLRETCAFQAIIFSTFENQI